MALKFDQKLDIPSKKNTKITTTSEKAYTVCFAVFSWLLRAFRRRFERFISRALLYYVNDKVGKIKVEYECNLTPLLRRVLQKPR